MASEHTKMVTPPFAHSYWLEPGRILCGEYPRDHDDAGTHSGMEAVLKAGVRCFVDLTGEGELKPYRDIARQTAQQLGIERDALEFHRHPIRDVSVPRQPGEMRAVLRTLRSARHRGVVAYLHCWGGKGRTGTVAGCLLREIFSLSGGRGLVLLRERWQACAKSSHSESPETAEQCRYVSDWPVESRGEKIEAAIAGAAVGDALGVPVEFHGRSQRVTDPVTGMREYGTHHQPAGTWSDDTSMILATLSGLTGAGDFEPSAVMEQFRRWVAGAKYTPHGEVFDIGIATRSAIRRFEQGTPPLDCGGTGEQSNGNGSLMRILPVALAWPDDPDLIDKASQLSALTHAHERSRFCCAFYCLVVSDLLHGDSIGEATAFAWQVMDQRWSFSAAERARFEKLHPDLLFAREEDSIGSSGHVIDTLEASLWVNARHDDFADAVLHAVNLGDDTDTTACVAGGLAGLIHGIGRIPQEWRDVLVARETLVAAADGFASSCAKFAPLT